MQIGQRMRSEGQSFVAWMRGTACPPERSGRTAMVAQVDIPQPLVGQCDCERSMPSVFVVCLCVCVRGAPGWHLGRVNRPPPAWHYPDGYVQARAARGVPSAEAASGANWEAPRPPPVGAAPPLHVLG